MFNLLMRFPAAQIIGPIGLFDVDLGYRCETSAFLKEYAYGLSDSQRLALQHLPRLQHLLLREHEWSSLPRPLDPLLC